MRLSWQLLLKAKKQWIADETTLKLSLSKPFSKQKPEAIQDLIEQVSPELLWKKMSLTLTQGD